MKPEEIELMVETIKILPAIAKSRGKEFDIWNYAFKWPNGIWYEDDFWQLWAVDLKKGEITIGGASFADPRHINIKDCIVIIHWETLEEILLSWDYYLDISDSFPYVCIITAIEESEMGGKGNFIKAMERSKIRQKAVMKAIVELAKEVCK